MLQLDILIVINVFNRSRPLRNASQKQPAGLDS